MQADFSQIVPFLTAALVVYAVYRRFRRSFGQQRLQTGRMTIRIGLLALAVCALLPLALRSAQFLSAEIVGAALGIVLAVWGAKRTRFVMSNGRLHYVPHTYTGIAVSMLFLARLAYRAVQAFTDGRTAHLDNAGTAVPAHAFAAMASPPTIGIVFVLACYYLWYYAWVLWKSKHLGPQDMEATPVATAR